MTVHVVMPVFNRLELTKTIIECLNTQDVDEPINVVVVNDGSADGTEEYLNSQPDVTVLQGDGNLWWGGSIDLAFRYVFSKTKNDDWVLLVNNDTQYKSNFIQTLLDTARHNMPSAVGSVMRDEDAPHNLISISTKIDSWWMLVSETVGSEVTTPEVNKTIDVLEVDALSGRGVLYPVSVLKKVKGMRSGFLPHYLADYELSLRVKKAGCNLLVDTKSVVYSKDEFGNTKQASSLFKKLFSVRSPSYLPAVIVFWWEASSWMQRLTLPLRLAIFITFPKLRGARR